MNSFLPTFRLLPLLTLALFTCTGLATAQGKPDLVLVSVGISKFEHRPYEKGVVAAAKDALDVAKAYQDQQGRLYDKVHSRVLLNEQATRDNIEAALAWARKQASATTHVVIFLASHAGPDSVGQYSFTPHDANPLLPSTNLTSTSIRKHLSALPGKCFLILDTCFSGGANRLGGVNFLTLAACSHREVSSEHGDRDLGNGYFTRAFLEGFHGKADRDGDGIVTLEELDAFVTSRLDQLSKGRQRFTMNRPRDFVHSFALSHAVVSSSAFVADRLR